jgi:hypothetical protein
VRFGTAVRRALARPPYAVVVHVDGIRELDTAIRAVVVHVDDNGLSGDR